jgi:hypothetical protein
VASCGPLCQICKAPNERTIARCENATCGFSCRDDAPKCSDGSCSILAWSFDSGTLGGIVVRSSSGQPLAVRPFGGGNALAVDVSQLNTLSEVSFDLPICTSGAIDLHSKTLTFRVNFDGTPPSMYNAWVQSAVPTPKAGAYLDQINPATGTWTQYSSPLSKSMFGNAVTTITIQAGSLGGAFTGTIWFDDFKIQ